MLNRLPKTALPLIAVLLAVVAYWFYWSSLVDRLKLEVTNWAASQAESGINVTWDDLRASGWPLRLRLEFDNLRYEATGAETPWSWSAPEFHAHALPYKLTHIIASAKSPMRITYGRGTGVREWEVTADSTEASYVIETDVPARLAFDIQAVTALRLDHPAQVSAARLQLHARKSEETEGSVDLALRGADITVDDAFAPGLMDLMGPTIAHLGIQARVTAAAGDRVFQDIALLELEGSEIQVSQGTAMWGPASALATGKLTVSAQRIANGRFDTTLKGYDAIIDGLVRQKLVDADLENPLKAALSLLSLTSGAEPGSVRMPLIIKNNDVYLGPVRVTGQGRSTN